MTDILDCGHAPSEHSPFTNGYGTDKDGKRLCYDCCAELERKSMMDTGKAVLYLVGCKRDDITWKVTDWPGKLEFQVVWANHSKAAAFGGYIDRTDFWFRGPDGFIWHGVSKGDMDLARCRRTKRTTW
jgi:hypothetical protein